MPYTIFIPTNNLLCGQYKYLCIHCSSKYKEKYKGTIKGKYKRNYKRKYKETNYIEPLEHEPFNFKFQGK